MIHVATRVVLEGSLVPYPPPPPPIQVPSLPLDLPRSGPLVLGSENAFVVTATLISIREMSVPLEVRLIASMPGGAPVVVAGPAELSVVGQSVVLDSGLVGAPLGRARFHSTAGHYVFSVTLRTYRR